MSGVELHPARYLPDQNVGIREEEDDIWLVSSMQYDIGYFDLEACRVSP